jgi:hypothetical protein
MQRNLNMSKTGTYEASRRAWLIVAGRLQILWLYPTSMAGNGRNWQLCSHMVSAAAGFLAARTGSACPLPSSSSVCIYDTQACLLFFSLSQSLHSVNGRNECSSVAK